MTIKPIRWGVDFARRVILTGMFAALGMAEAHGVVITTNLVFAGQPASSQVGAVLTNVVVQIRDCAARMFRSRACPLRCRYTAAAAVA